MAATFDNPFDPDDVALDAQIARPTAHVSLPGFFDVPCRLDTGDRERVRPAGPACWRFRFTPTVAGKYQAVVRVRDRSGQAACPPVSFEAVPSKRPGFVRVAPASPLYFQFDNGRSYFPVGENVCWAGRPQAGRRLHGLVPRLGGPRRQLGPAVAGHHGERPGVDRVAHAQGRTRPLPRLGTLLDRELLATGPGGPPGGRDRHPLDVLYRHVRRDQAGRRLFQCQPVGQQSLQRGQRRPVRQPKDFFTSPAARKLYQRRLRYILARWGYSPHVFAWEFWNEYQRRPSGSRRWPPFSSSTTPTGTW